MRLHLLVACLFLHFQISGIREQSLSGCVRLVLTDTLDCWCFVLGVVKILADIDFPNVIHVCCKVSAEFREGICDE